MNVVLASALSRSHKSAGDGMGKFYASDPEIKSERQLRYEGKLRAVVLTKIGLRSGDNTDVLMMLGLIPTPPKPKPVSVPFECPDCIRSFRSSHARAVHSRVHKAVR